MEAAHRESALRMSVRLARSRPTPTELRAALTSIPPEARDGWIDLVLGLDGPPADGPALPRGGVPYLPCTVDALLRVIEQADVQSSDVFVDIGAGVGRAAAIVQLLTGAATIGLEIQPALAAAARELATRTNTRMSVVEGDAAELAGSITTGSVFFLYCPFSGARLDKVLDDLEAIACTRPIRVCSVDLPPLRRRWLTPVAPPTEDLAVYRSTLLDAGAPVRVASPTAR